MIKKLKHIYEFIFDEIPNFIKNIYLFKDLLFKYRKYDYYACFWALRIILKNLKIELLKSKEVTITKCKKIDKIERCVQILDNIIEDRYFDMAQAIHGKFIMDENFEEPSKEQSDLNLIIVNEKRKLEKEEWFELFDTLKGQDINDLIMIEKITGKGLYEEWFDGSGLNGWWR